MELPILKLIKTKSMPIITDIDESRTVVFDTYVGIAADVGSSITTMCEVRRDGDFSNLAIWLNADFDWSLGLDNKGQHILVPTKKQI